ncbi:hypothetical protein [Planctomonas psychrotolerans]|uniref:hypothetical protein n=1 Tax=Planctomonas psychrotolerans TaxID=2528712 RepID=UPI00123889A2|nr:hypothetical protein [Planctomonas psychrotolerans]
MTLRRWRIWFVLGNTAVVLGLTIGASLWRDGNPGWIAWAVVGVVGLAGMVVAGIRRRPTEKREAAERAAAGPDPRRWRIVETTDDE